MWNTNQLPPDVDLQARIPLERMHAEGKKVPDVPPSLTTAQKQRLLKNRLFTTKIRNIPKRISFLLDRYGSMHVEFIHKAIDMLPDSSPSSQFQSGIEKALDNARLFNRYDHGP
jgi:hypothetical protein